MGIVRRQSIYNTLLIYLGIAIGFLNKVVIFQWYLSKAEYGLLGLIATTMVLGSELSQFGVARLVYRFFPHFKRDPGRAGAFTGFVILYTLGGYGLMLLLLTPLQGSLVGFFAERSPLFTSQFYLLVPAVLAFSFYRVGEALARSHLRSVVPTLTWEVLVRLWQMGVVLLYAFDYLSFDAFALGYILSFFLPALVIFAYLFQQGKLQINWQLRRLPPRVMRVLVRFSLITSLSYAAYFIVLRIDMFMIGGLISEEAAGAYDFAYYLVILLLTPTKSLTSIILPLFADHLKHRRLEEVRQLHARTSASSFVLAQLIFILMYINLDALFTIFPKFSEAKSVILYLGLGHISTALMAGMRFLIINSRHYRFDFFSNLVLVAVVISSNYVMIPRYGIDGAAIATAGSMILYNLTGFLFVRSRFGLRSFGWKTLLSILLGLLCFWLGTMIPALDNPWFDMILRTAIMLPFYMGLVLWLRLSPDLNEAVILGLTKLGLKKR